MTKKKKAKKNKLKMPKLSFVDKLIYGVLCVLLVAVSGLIIAIPLIFRNRIAFADPLMVAAVARGGIYWMLVPFVTFLTMGASILGIAHGGRYPIFGRRDIQYGSPKYPKVYPLFMKNKPKVWVSENAKKSKKTIAVVLVVILLLSFVPYPLSFYGRDCLYRDGSIGQYNAFNVKTRSFLPRDITAVKIKTTRSSSRRGVSDHYGVTVTLTANVGESYSFGAGDFESNDWLSQMLALKCRYDSHIITYETEYPLESVIREYNLSEEETALLYQLFGRE